MSRKSYMIVLYFIAIAFESAVCCGFHATGYQQLTTPFYFSFMKNEKMHITFTLENVPSNIVNASLSLQTGEWFSEVPISPEKYNSTAKEFCLHLDHTMAMSVLKLYTLNGLCHQALLGYGQEKRELYWTTDDKFKRLHCFSSPKIACAVVVDLKNACKDQSKKSRTRIMPILTPEFTEFLKLNTRNVAYTKLATRNVVNTSNEHFPVNDTVRRSLNNTDTKNSTSVNSDISNATQNMSKSADNSKEGVTETSLIVIISSVAGGAVLCVIVVVVVWKCRRSTRPALADVPPGPFYVNNLFREECEREIAQVELQNQYEEIHPLRY